LFLNNFINFFFLSFQVFHTDSEGHFLLSFNFFIYNNFVRSREEAQKNIITTISMLEDKKDLLQLMKDIVSVIQKTNPSSPLSDLDLKYHSLNCNINPIDRNSFEFSKIEKYILNSQVKTKDIKVLRKNTDFFIIFIFIFIFFKKVFLNWTNQLKVAISFLLEMNNFVFMEHEALLYLEFFQEDYSCQNILKVK
jgi:hypothetical protein